MPVSRCVPFTDAGISCPACLCSIGLSSNRSTCDSPPLWNRQSTRFAFGAKCGSFGAPASPAVSAARASPGNSSEPSADRADARA